MSVYVPPSTAEGNTGCSGSCGTLYDQQYAYLGNYLNAHMLSTPSHRYAYLMWFVIAGVVIISAAIHHAGVGDKTWVGAAWTKFAPKARVIKLGRKQDPSSLMSRTRSNDNGNAGAAASHSYPPKGAAQLAPNAPPTTGRQRYVITLPSIGRLFLVFWLVAVPVILTLVGADYIRPTAGMFDLSASWPNASDARYGYYSKRALDWGLGSFSPISTTPATYSIPYHTWWTSGGRTGLMTNALTPFVTVLALKQVPWALLSTRALGGHAFERLSFLHKWGGRLIWVFASAHTITWSIQLSKDKQFNSSLWGFIFIWPRFRWAFVSMGFLTLLVLLSLGPIRRNYYEVFFVGHIVCVIGFMAAAAAHHPPLAGWMIAALAWWGAERITRLVKVAYVNGIGFAGRKPQQVMVSSGAPRPPPQRAYSQPMQPPPHQQQHQPRRPPTQQESIGGHTSSSATLYDGSPALGPLRGSVGKPSFLDTDPRERQTMSAYEDEWELDENGDKIRRRPSQRYGPVSDLLKEYAGPRSSAMDGIEEDVPLAASSQSGSATPSDDADRWGQGQDLGNASAYHEEAWRGRRQSYRSSQSHTLEGMGPLSSADHYTSAPPPQQQQQQQQQQQYAARPPRPTTADSYARRDWSPSGSVDRDPRPALPADVAALIKPGYAFAQVLPGKTLRLTLRTPNRMSWYPGQWVYLNVPAVKGWQSHPFTIASAYDAAMPIVSTHGDGDLEKGLRKERRKRGEERTMVLLLRARKGFTLDLWEYVRRHRHRQVVAAEESGMPVLEGSIANTTGVHLRAIVDGAYGSTKRVRWGIHSSIVIVCGGSGISFGMSLLEHLCACMTQRNVYGTSKRGGKDFEVRRVRFVWILREFSHLQWVSSALRRCIEMVPPEQLQVDLFVTHLNNQVAFNARGGLPMRASSYDVLSSSRPQTAETWQSTTDSGGAQGWQSRDTAHGWQTASGDVVEPARGPQRLMEGGDADDLDIGFNDLTEFDGEDMAGPSAAEQAINSRIQREGKLRRANTRKATLKRNKKNKQEGEGMAVGGEDAMRVAAQRAMFEGHIQADVDTAVSSPAARPPLGRPSARPPTRPATGRSANGGASLMPPPPGGSHPNSGTSTPLSWDAAGQHDVLATPTPGGGSSDLNHWRMPSFAGSSANLLSSSTHDTGYHHNNGAATPTPSVLARDHFAGFDDSPIDLDAEEDLDLRLIAELAQPGHPRLDRLVAGEVQRSQGRVMVASCGPESLSAILRRIVAKHIDPAKARRGDQSGIVNLCTESFEWGGS